MNRTVLLILLLALCSVTSSITLNYVKRNIYIPQQSQYKSTIELKRENAELIPTTLSLTNTVANSIPTFGDYFDYFYYLTPRDLFCYESSVLNESYMFPCSFIDSQYSALRTSYVDSVEISQSIEEINDISFALVVDNTNFPYPYGSYSYSPINVDLTVNLELNVNSSYRDMAIKLIFINVTLFLIFVIIMITLICKTRRLTNKMAVSKDEETKASLLHLNESRSDSDSSDHDDEQPEVLSSSRMEVHEQDLFRHRMQSQQNTARMIFSGRKSLRRSLLPDERDQ